jgi:hypothetical protein
VSHKNSYESDKNSYEFETGKQEFERIFKEFGRSVYLTGSGANEHAIKFKI